MSNEYTLKAPLFKWYFSWGSPPYTLNPLWARFATTEAEFPTLCGDGYHRVYRGEYCKSEPYKGYMLYKAGTEYSYESEIGFREKEQVLGWLDKSDGYFKMKVPVGALPLEPCALAYAHPFSGVKKGVRRVSRWSGNAIIRPTIILTPYGAVFDGDYGDFLWVTPSTHGWTTAGRYTITGQERIGTYPSGQPQYRYSTSHFRVDTRRAVMWNVRTIGTGWNTVSHIERWEATDVGEPLTRYYETAPAVEVYFYTRKSDGFRYGYQGTVISPWFHVGEWQARMVVYAAGNMSYLAWQFNNGRFMTVGQYNLLYSNLIDDVYFGTGTTTANLAKRVIYGPLPDDDYYASNEMGITGAVWEITPQQMHSACTRLGYREFRDKIILYAWEIVSEEIGYCRKVWIVKRDDGTLIQAWNPPQDEDFAITMIGGSPYVERQDADGRKKLVSIANGNAFYWRNTYRWNGLPANLGYDDTTLWEVASDANHPAVVFYGDCSLVGNPGDPYMIINESQFTDLSGGCAAGSYRGEARYVITTLVDKDPVSGALVTCRIVGETVGTNAQVHHDQTVQLPTEQDGSVIFLPNTCIAGAEPFVLSFTVLDVVKPEKTYLPASNSAPATVYQQYGEEPPPPSSISPDPSEFTSSSPFQVLQSGTYYHVMAAAQVTTVPANEPVEYKFTCVDNGTFSSPWRNADNVAGKFNPNGTPQTPQTYWVQVGIKNLMYRWKVQYRLKNNPSVIAAESPQKQITNVLP